MKASALIWSPTHEYLGEAVAKNQRLRLVVSPFITLEALTYVIDRVIDREALEVVVRWRGEDLLNGASDLSIYPFLRGEGIPLFCHDRIHLKLLVFDQARAFHSSGNVTRNGLGLNLPGNIEVGCEVQMQNDDWTQLYSLLSESIPVDDEVFNQAETYLERYQTSNRTTPVPKLVLEEPNKKLFSWLALPATSNPDELWRYYAGELDEATVREVSAAAAKDLMIFRMPNGMGQSDFYRILSSNFRNHPFVEKFVAHLAAERSLAFGAVKQWIQENCSDKPRPFRKDLNSTVRTLYDWLQYFFDEISWDRPRHSMVVFWSPVDNPCS